ncbi:MAG: 3-deoxy-8-phosphooctulonate synthase [Gemmatimonadota bacterium]|nr:3-deoxy-8-phosphooctulonate synthase [Gemmatimonadota bacterium]MDH4351010.1 3-deoxy-8-phosphooctulonate synthase [Gemmatimonadota bacterium]MDH5197020.1 3-deoxy-8-phosphooctulonate synthase [Gemmatimonadota bacterium]
MWTPAPVVVAGPCVLEDDTLNLRVAEAVAEVGARLGVRMLFKGSFDKANRARRGAPRGPGLHEGLAMLARIRSEVGLPVVTDIHEVAQVAAVAAVADVIQIPAFLCRQTDLVEAAGRAGRAVNVKKGQWMAPEEMAGPVEKARAAGAAAVAVTERGTAFGYGDLVVDMRAFVRVREAAGCPVLYDATHSVQRPGRGPGGASGGDRAMVPLLLRAAAAAGADGFYLETHPSPAGAPSDAATMWPLDELSALLEPALEIWHAGQEGRIGV